jgi:acyl-CoA thioester hydrolase
MPEHNKIEDFTRRIHLPVRWGDMDSMGHVNNAMFFTFDESGRIGYFQELMKDDSRFWKDYGFILAHVEADFIAQLRYPATLEIGTRVSRIGGRSLNTLSAMFSEGKLIAVTKGVVVWFDYGKQQTLPIPSHVRTLINGFERVKPEQ